MLRRVLGGAHSFRGAGAVEDPVANLNRWNTEPRTSTFLLK